MQHTTYLRQLGYTLTFFGLFVFSGCDFLKKIQKKYWPNSNKGIDIYQENIYKKQSVRAIKKPNASSHPERKTLNKRYKNRNDRDKKKDNAYEEQAWDQGITYTDRLLTALFNNNSFDIERKNIIATLIITNPGWINNIERHDVSVIEGLSIIDRTIDQAQAYQEEQHSMRLFSLISRSRVNSFDERPLQDIEENSAPGVTEIEPGVTEIEPASSQQVSTFDETWEEQVQRWKEEDRQAGERGEEGPDIFQQWGEPGCPICYDANKTNTVVVPCQNLRKDRHIFHSDCLKKSVAAQYLIQDEEGLQRAATCPICRGKIL